MKTTRWASLALAAALSTFACHRGANANASDASAAAPLHELTVADLSARLREHQPVNVFDNNSHDSYLQGHIPSARWVAFNHVTAGDLPSDHGAMLVFYCHSES